MTKNNPNRSRIERVAALADELNKVSNFQGDTDFIAFLNTTLETIGCEYKVVERK